MRRFDKIITRTEKRELEVKQLTRSSLLVVMDLTASFPGRFARKLDGFSDPSGRFTSHAPSLGCKRSYIITSLLFSEIKKKKDNMVSSEPRSTP